jgi:hypothetical protein
MISKFAEYNFIQWECCSNIWQVGFSPGTYENRKDWKPECPSCGSTGKSFVELMKDRRDRLKKVAKGE